MNQFMETSAIRRFPMRIYEVEKLVVTAQLAKPSTAFYPVRNLVEQVADCGEIAIGSGYVFQSSASQAEYDILPGEKLG